MIISKNYVTWSEKETILVAEKLATQFKGNEVVLLSGDLVISTGCPEAKQNKQDGKIILIEA